ncbi:MAG TPA: nitroreductase family protein, partial [Candidatus Limnocylindrales bacterium]|nr:nitroreductase family protein [Candidatus Limnocylindrales bacterium]
TMAQRAGDTDMLGRPVPAGEPLAGPIPPSVDLDAIAARSSPRVFNGSASVSEDVFRWSMATSLRGSRVDHFVAVLGVDGVEPGLYRWPDLQRPIRSGNLREEAFRVCVDQELGRDAAFVVIGATDIEQIDDRGYREAQLDSGLVGGRFHLAAAALGIGASGMTLYDGDLPEFLGEPLAGLMLTCVGVPSRRGLPGGPPGEPIVLPSQRVTG